MEILLILFFLAIVAYFLFSGKKDSSGSVPPADVNPGDAPAAGDSIDLGGNNLNQDSSHQDLR